ncbi:Atrochrysone carboxyl ACP thioesterase [Metarhizium anisopliae]|nr:Atrochrysone carboxyl ACP thioesterase [Metarhizium anisopliae]
MVQDINTAVMQADKGGYRQINKSLNICAFEDYLQGQTTNLPNLPNVEQLTPRVLRILGQNPGKFTYQGTNTYVIGTGAHRLIVDTSGGEPAWAELVSSTLESMGVSLSHVLLTHWHGDHTGGVPDLLRLYPHLEGSIYKNEPDKGQQNITDGQLRRERQVMQALGRARTRGERSITIQGLVTEIYGEALEESTRTLALEPFINEVLRKLAGDCRVAFEIRGGKKKWYSVEAMPQNAGGLMPGPMTASRADARVQVM